MIPYFIVVKPRAFSMYCESTKNHSGCTCIFKGPNPSTLLTYSLQHAPNKSEPLNELTHLRLQPKAQASLPPDGTYPWGKFYMLLKVCSSYAGLHAKNSSGVLMTSEDSRLIITMMTHNNINPLYVLTMSQAVFIPIIYTVFCSVNLRNCSMK